MIGQKGVPATYGGVERHVEELASRLAKRGWEITVYCRPHYTPSTASVPGVNLVRLPSINTKHLDTITHVAVSSLHALRSKANLIHYHALGPSSLAWLPRAFGKRIVVTVHGLDWRREKWGPLASRYLRMSEWTATNLAHRTIVVSKTLRDYFESAGARNISYIPNGAVLPEPAPTEPLARFGLEPDKYILFVGRLVPEKGLDVLLKAHRQAVPHWKLAIVGGGHFTDAYVDACRRLGNANVRFLGPVYGAELKSIQQHAAVVVAPSTLEGLSIAILEAMSFGRPVLASDISENREVLEGCGECFRAGDSADLGTRLRAMLASPERCAEMGRRARSRIAAEYDWERTVTRTEQVYDLATNTALE